MIELLCVGPSWVYKRSMTRHVLTQTRSVLHLAVDATTNTHTVFRYLSDDDGPYQYREVTLDFADWDDMGRPDQITITIEPGDLLNEVSDV